VTITADTNVLVRVLMDDDPQQAQSARVALAQAERVVLPVPVLCELVWVLARGYGVDRAGIATAIRTLLDSATVVTDRSAALAGLAMLEAGGDFADGTIAHIGAALGGRTFVSFDKRAVRLLEQQGHAARLLS
jgi:predicted nucleic-acid-binding protein